MQEPEGVFGKKEMELFNQLPPPSLESMNQVARMIHSDFLSALANFDSAILGFSPADGTLVYRDPVITESNSDAAKIGFSVVSYPFV